MIADTIYKKVSLTSHPVQGESSPPVSWNHRDSGTTLFQIKNTWQLTCADLIIMYTSCKCNQNTNNCNCLTPQNEWSWSIL